MIREADHLMAEGIRTVAALYKDGLLKPDGGGGGSAGSRGLPRSPHLPRRADPDRAAALRHVPRAPHAHVPGHVPRQSRLRAVVRLERDAAGSEPRSRRWPPRCAPANTNVPLVQTRNRPPHGARRTHDPSIPGVTACRPRSLALRSELRRRQRRATERSSSSSPRPARARAQERALYSGHLGERRRAPYTLSIAKAPFRRGTSTNPTDESITIAGTPSTIGTFSFTVRRGQ